MTNYHEDTSLKTLSLLSGFLTKSLLPFNLYILTNTKLAALVLYTPKLKQEILQVYIDNLWIIILHLKQDREYVWNPKWKQDIKPLNPKSCSLIRIVPRGTEFVCRWGFGKGAILWTMAPFFELRCLDLAYNLHRNTELLAPVPSSFLAPKHLTMHLQQKTQFPPSPLGRGHCTVTGTYICPTFCILKLGNDDYFWTAKY